ncbi:MAG: alpha/beta hydrolase [Chitinophagaceae bacterium]|nr:alpha/beta hydrolase [Chitinophagaceae bacterium]
MKKLKIAVVVLLLLTIVYLLGPHPATPVYDTKLPDAPADLQQLSQYVSQLERVQKVKEDNEAKIVWNNDSMPAKTKYAIVYLHGFSASHEEGNPVHITIAREMGANLYLSRLADHGVDTTEPFMQLTADRYWETCKQALAIGSKLGEKVILMATSTGGTNALQLAAAYPDKIAGLILYSPNIAINDPNAWLLNNPWGLQIARLVKGSDYNITPDQRPIYKKYWYSKYRLEGAVALEELLETTMNEETFKKIHQPTLVLCYYKDEEHQDPVVKVSAMKTMFEQLGTAAANKQMVELPNVGDHVLASPIKSKDVESVLKYTRSFVKAQFQ